MQGRIDSAGKIKVPDELREQLGLRPGTPVELRAVRGRLEITAHFTPGRRFARQPLEDSEIEALLAWTPSR